MRLNFNFHGATIHAPELVKAKAKTIEFGLLLNVVYDDQTGMALFTGNEDTVIELSGGIEFALQFPPTERDMSAHMQPAG